MKIACWTLLALLSQDSGKFAEEAGRLGDESPARREQAEEAIEKMGAAVLPRLEELVKSHADKEVRARAARVAERIRNRAALKAQEDAWYRAESGQAYCRLQLSEETWQGRPAWRMKDTVVGKRRLKDQEFRTEEVYEAVTLRDENFTLLWARVAASGSHPTQGAMDIVIEAAVKEGKVVLSTPKFEIPKSSEGKDRDPKALFNREVEAPRPLLWYRSLTRRAVTLAPGTLVPETVSRFILPEDAVLKSFQDLKWLDDETLRLGDRDVRTRVLQVTRSGSHGNIWIDPDRRVVRFKLGDTFVLADEKGARKGIDRD